MKAGLVYIFLVWMVSFHFGAGYKKFIVTMPDVSPKKYTLERILPLYLKKASFKNILCWDCLTDRPCAAGEETIVYAWAKNAPELRLPRNVGYVLGRSVRRYYLVIQVHYSRPLTDIEVDTTGVAVYLTQRKQKFSAGIYLFETSRFSIPPKSIGHHVDISCKYAGSPILPFAFRTHAHSHGRVISAYKIHNDEWSLIGIGTPQRAQAFYPVTAENRKAIRTGDQLAARCTFDNQNSSQPVLPGSYSDSEMCNFYMMYYTKAHHNIPSGCYRFTTKLRFPKGSDVWPPDSNMMITTPSVETKSPKMSITLTTMSATTSRVTNIHSPMHPSPHNLSTTPSPVLYPEPSLHDNWSIDTNKDIRQIYGLALDEADHVVVLHRGGEPSKYYVFDEENVYIGPNEPISQQTILHLHANNGSVVKASCKDIFYVPHGLCIDHLGNYWVTDIALHQVLKFSNNNFEKPSLILGERFVPGYDDTHFCKPTDVVVDRDGNVYIADGFCNDRIMKFSSDGKLLTKWGNSTEGATPGAGDFRTPLSLSLDHSSKHLYVCDSFNGRIQVFDTQGRFVKVIKHAEFGTRLSALHFNAAYGGILYVVSRESSGHTPKGFTINANTGRILNTWNVYDKGLQEPRDIISSSDDTTLYVSEVGPNRVWKFDIKNPFDVSIRRHKGHEKSHFPWREVSQPKKHDNSSVVPKTVDNNYEDDISMAPAVVVVVVLATPIILVFVAAVIQHMRFKSRQKKVLRQKRRNTLRNKNVELCFGCCITPRYYFDDKRGFDKLIPEHSEESSEEEDSFTRKA